MEIKTNSRIAKEQQADEEAAEHPPWEEIRDLSLRQILLESAIQIVKGKVYITMKDGELQDLTIEGLEE